MKDEEMDQLFRDAAAKNNVQPSADLWSRISEELDSHKEPKRIKTSSWPRYAAVAALFILAFTLTLYLQQDPIGPTEELPVHAQQPVSTDSSNSSSDAPLNHSAAPSMGAPAVLATNIEKQAAPRRVQAMRAALTEESLPPSGSSLAEVEPLPHDEPLDVLAYQEDLEPDTHLASIQPPAEQPSYTVEMPSDYPITEGVVAEQEASNDNKTLLTHVLNTVSEVISPTEKSLVQFSQDDEGSLKIDLGQLFPRNKTNRKK